MKSNYRMLLILIIVFSISTIASPSFGEEPSLPQLDIEYDKFELENGLTVLVHTDHSRPTVFVGMWYDVGSKNEPAGKTGFAHLFEHLMFQATENRDGEYSAPFSDAGAVGLNGTTNEDRTNYYATVPSGALDMALWMESDRMTYLAGGITQETLDEQRGVVQNEKRQREDQPYSAVNEKIRAAIYPEDHPYGHSVIGSMEDLNAATLEDVRDWFRSYYGGLNTVLVLSGDIDLATAKEKVLYYFGEAPAGKPLSQHKQWVPSIEHTRKETMYDNVAQTRITRVWTIPGRQNSESSLLYLVGESLAGKKNSPLHKVLVDELGLATGISSTPLNAPITGEFRLTIDLKAGVKPEEVTPIVDELIAQYLDKGPERQIIDDAMLELEMYVYSEAESGSSIGRILAEGELFLGDPLFFNKELAWLGSATTDELREVANRWLTRNYYELTVEPIPESTSVASEVDRSTIPAVTVKSDISFPEIETATLENGMRMVIAKYGSTPLLNVSVRVNTGRVFAPIDSPRLGEFVFNLLDKGTENSDASDVAALKDKLGMGAGGFQSGLMGSTYGYRVLRSKFSDSLELIAETLREPTFPDEEIDKMKVQLETMFTGLQKTPSNGAGALFNKAIYGGDHALGSVWKPQHSESVTREAIEQFHADQVRPDNITIYVIGDISLDEAKQSVEGSFATWDVQQAEQVEEVRAHVPALEQRPRVILVDQPDAESTMIVAGHSLPEYDPETATLQSVVSMVLGGGFESRLNMNIREDKGWAYGFGASTAAMPTGHQQFMAGGAVQTDKTAESMQELMREMQQYISDRPATAEEIDRIKLHRIRSLPALYSSSAGFLSSIVQSDGFGLPLDYGEGTAERTSEISVNDVNEQAKTLLSPDNLTWVVVGDLGKFEQDVRDLNYGEVEVWNVFGERLR